MYNKKGKQFFSSGSQTISNPQDRVIRLSARMRSVQEAHPQRSSHASVRLNPEHLAG
jgi:hypothetical protein